MPLVIVESPMKCGKLRKILGANFEIISSVGHIMDLKRKDLGINFDTWEPIYAINSDKKDVVKSIKEAAKRHDEIYVATDSDNEGHCISFNIKDILPKRGKKIYRVVFETITKKDVLDGIKNPIPFDSNAYDAQKVRRMTDRLVGFKVSPVMWAKGLKNTSAGRVQSAVLKWIVEKEMAVRAFVKEEYWNINADMDDGFMAEFYGIGGKKYVPKNEKQAMNIVDDIKGQLKVTDYSKKTRDRNPSPPFITTTMQKDAGYKFKWTGKKVMSTAQTLFSQGLISYHRSDSVRSSPEKIKELRKQIEKDHGKQYLSGKTIIYKNTKTSQDAHEAIRPTFEPIPMGLGADERRLLSLITNRFVASQMASAKFDQAAIKFEYKGKKVYNFKANGSVLQFDGFLKVYGGAGKNVALPAMRVGQALKIRVVIPSQHFTKPPARYTAPGSLIDRMDKEGIGRPATYVATVETLLRHKYITRDKQILKPTEVGIMVSDYLKEYFKELTSASFTASMELELDQIAEGKADLTKSLDVFYKKLVSSIDSAKKADPSKIFKTDLECSKCKDGSKMTRKISKYGVFLGCEKYPVCGHVVTYDEDGVAKDSSVETGTSCPDCNGLVVEREGKWGKWASCQNYPTCSWKGKLDNDGNIVEKKTEAEKTDIDCPKCGKKMLKRPSKYGNGFWLGCSGYPKCKGKMTLDDKGKALPAKKKKTAKDTGKVCPKCKKNNLVERPSKYGAGTWISCGGFPKCRYIKK